MIPEITTLTIAELAPRIKTGAVSPVELTELYLQRIEKLDPLLNAYVTVTAEQARSQAKIVQTRDQRRKIPRCATWYPCCHQGQPRNQRNPNYGWIEDPFRLGTRF